MNLLKTMEQELNVIIGKLETYKEYVQLALNWEIKSATQLSFEINLRRKLTLPVGLLLLVMIIQPGIWVVISSFSFN